jgi:hypothetical protein
MNRRNRKQGIFCDDDDRCPFVSTRKAEAPIFKFFTMKGTTLKTFRIAILALLATFVFVTETQAVSYWGRPYNSLRLRLVLAPPADGDFGEVELHCIF